MIALVPGHCILVTFKPSKKEKLSYMCMATLFRSFSHSICLDMLVNF